MKPDDIARYVDAAAAAIGLPLAAAHRPGVLQYLALAAGMAEQVEGLDLGIVDEPAEVFIPIAPEDLP